MTHLVFNDIIIIIIIYFLKFDNIIRATTIIIYLKDIMWVLGNNILH
jgi:hypothetical protein